MTKLTSNNFGIWINDGTNDLPIGVSSDWALDEPNADYESKLHGENQPKRVSTGFGDFTGSFSIEVPAVAEDDAYDQLLTYAVANTAFTLKVQAGFPTPEINGGEVLIRTRGQAIPGADGVLTQAFTFAATGTTAWATETITPVP